MSVEDTILRECAERRRVLGLRDPGPRPFVPPVSASCRDLHTTQLADLVVLVDAGYLEVAPRAEPRALRRAA